MEKIKVSEIRAKFPMYSDLSDDQLLSGIRQKFYADIPIAKFAGMIEYDTQRAAMQREITDEAGSVRNFAAGAGKALTDTARGIGQFFGGGPSRADVDAIQRQDAGLMDTKAGIAGNFTGTIAPALLTAAIPGVNGLVGASAVGAGMGMLKPVGTADSRLQNTAVGGLAGAGGVAVGRAIKGIAGAGAALLAPFTQGGREKIAGRAIQRFADDPSKVARATGARTATGAMPTIAEETGDAGMARLQDAVQALDPQISSRIGQRLRDNNAARVGSIESLAGDSTRRGAAEAARSAAASPLYDRAVAQTVPITPELRALLNRPSVQKALERASNIAKEDGRKFDLAGAISGHSHGAPAGPKPINIVDEAGRVLSSIKPDAPIKAVSGQTLQDLKMGMDALLKDPTSGIAGKEASLVKSTRDELLKWMEATIPEFKTARTAYASGSKPINAMDVAQELARRGTSNLSDLSGNPRMQANALLGALRDEPGLIERATGRNGINALSDVFEPAQLNLLRQVASEADRTAAVASAGAGPGSATAQRLASQNVLERLIGPTGLPTSWAESALANTVVGKPLNLIYGNVAEAKIQQALADAVLDPAKARQFIAAAQKQGLKLPDNAATRALMQIARTSAPAALVSQPERR